jgi:hypothetical protein
VADNGMSRIARIDARGTGLFRMRMAPRGEASHAYARRALEMNQSARARLALILSCPHHRFLLT